MALKDKLMTLEDFKAVRDVDVASNSAQFTEIKADLGAVTKETSNIYDAKTFTGKPIAINSSGKCLFFTNTSQPYRGFIFPFTTTKNLGVKFSSDATGISSVKFACFAQEPKTNNDEYTALSVISAGISGGYGKGILTNQENALYYGFFVSFASGANYDQIMSGIEQSLVIFETEEIAISNVSWDDIEYVPHTVVDVVMASLPNELMDSIDAKVQKVSGMGLSHNDYTNNDVQRLNDCHSQLFGESDIIVQYGDSGITAESWASTSDGAIKHTASTAIYDVTGLIPCSSGDSLYLLEVQSLVFYKSDGTYSSSVTISSIEGYTGNGLQNDYIITDANAAFMRVNFYNSNYSSQMVDGYYAVCKRNTLAYSILNLGDSIFGLNPKPYDISTKIQDITHIKTANCGFGGTRASTHTLSDYINFSLYNLADAIASGDFTLQDGSDFSTLGSGYFYRYNLRTLKSIDFSSLSVITIAYGTNDWNANIPLDNANDKEDTTTFKGAIRYAVNKIQSAYPGVMIVLLSPIYRTFNNDTEDSSTKVNSGGKTLLDYVNAVKEVAEELVLPFVDNYHNAGINIYNCATYLRIGGNNNDRTHLTFEAGASRLGTVTGKVLERFIN